MSHAAHTHRGRYRRPMLFFTLGVICLFGAGLAYGALGATNPAANLAADRHHQQLGFSRSHHRLRLPHANVTYQPTVPATASPTPDPAPVTTAPPTSATTPPPTSATTPPPTTVSAPAPSSATTTAAPSTSAPPPSGSFPGPGNTGYQNAPGYPGQLTNCNNLTVKSNTTYSFCDFPNGLVVGSSGNHVSNVTFIGCRFADTNPNDANVADYGLNIRFSYSTFAPGNPGSEPTTPGAAPVAASQSYEYGIDLRSDGGLTIDHSDFWGFSDAVQFADSTQAYPLVITDSWIHNPSHDSSGAAHVDGILDSYGDASYLTFTHDTIVGDGNTQALALQGNGGYSHLTITGNYFAGFGYMLDFGGHGTSTDVTFTGNTWGTDIEPAYGPVYDPHIFTTSGLGNTWSGNKLAVVAGTSWMAAANNGLYWWPNDGNPDNSSKVVGHTADYSGP